MQASDIFRCCHALLLRLTLSDADCLLLLLCTSSAMRCFCYAPLMLCAASAMCCFCYAPLLLCMVPCLLQSLFPFTYDVNRFFVLRTYHSQSFRCPTISPRTSDICHELLRNRSGTLRRGHFQPNTDFFDCMAPCCRFLWGHDIALFRIWLKFDSPEPLRSPSERAFSAKYRFLRLHGPMLPLPMGP